MFKKIKKQYNHEFNIAKDDLYSITIEASCKSGKILGIFGGEDLRVEIDNLKLREIPAEKKAQYFNISPAWNGTKLKGLSKTVIFILKLNKGNHVLRFIPRKGAIIQKEPIISLLKNNKLTLNKQAQEGDKRPWIALALIDLKLKTLDVSVKCEQRKRDSDDVKIIIDNKVQENEQSSWWGKKWYFRGSQIKGNTEETRFYPKLSKGTHYIEFWADRMPVLNWVKMNIGVKLTEKLEKKEKEENKKDNIKAKVIWKTAALREEPKQKDQNILQEIKKGSEVFIIEKAIKGERPLNSKDEPMLSDRWHKVEFQGEIGYVYCETIEIEGEDEETIKSLIIQKSKEIDEDACLMLAIAKRESRLSPYMVSDVNAQGLFQLMSAPVIDVNKKFKKDFKDRFNILQNIEAGILYFQLVRKRYKDKDNFLERCLAAWNRGWKRVKIDEPFIFDKQPFKTQVFIKDVFKFQEECKIKIKNSGKVLVILLPLISLIIVSTLLFFSLKKETFAIPDKYGDFWILEEKMIDIDNNNKDEKIVIINDKPKSSFNTIKILAIQKNGNFIELPNEGSELQWWKVNDFNKNGKIDLAVLYGYSGSAGFGQFYLYEWNNSNFTTLISRDEINSKAKFKDLDNDGIEEILYSYRIDKWERDRQDIYKWSKESNEYVKS